MARVLLDIDDSMNHHTLASILKADGHSVVAAEADVIITDDALAAIPHARTAPTLVLTMASGLRAVVAAMRQGVYGYIFLPLQEGETELMVRRALGGATSSSPPMPSTLAEMERLHIRTALEYCHNNRAQAARLLGIGRNTLWRKLKSLGEGGE